MQPGSVREVRPSGGTPLYVLPPSHLCELAQAHFASGALHQVGIGEYHALPQPAIRRPERLVQPPVHAMVKHNLAEGAGGVPRAVELQESNMAGQA